MLDFAGANAHLRIEADLEVLPMRAHPAIPGDSITQSRMKTTGNFMHNEKNYAGDHARWWGSALPSAVCHLEQTVHCHETSRRQRQPAC